MPAAPPRGRRDVEWADGIRGIASMFVVSSHIVLAYIPKYLYPADGMDATPRLFQLPFFRIIACGPFWISIFFLLSGYVCAIKPLKLSAAGQADEARRVIASSAFRRLTRIGVPVLAGTLFPWALAQTGMYSIAPEVEIDKGWLSYTRPAYKQWFWPAVREPFLQFFNTWAKTQNLYEMNQWTLGWEMRASMLEFLVLSMTANFTVFWRRAFLFACAVYFFRTGEFPSPFLFFPGALFAELSLYLKAQPASVPRAIVDLPAALRPLARMIRNYWTTALTILAFYLASAPAEQPERAAWSRQLFQFFTKYISPTGGGNDRIIPAFGGIALMTSIHFSPGLRRFLSNRVFVFLGGVSFPVYLLHGTFIRIFLTWAFFRFLPALPFLNILHESTDANGDVIVEARCDTMGCRLSALVVLVIWFTFLLTFARLWKSKVDVWAMHISKYTEDVVTGKREIEFPKFPIGLWQNRYARLSEKMRELESEKKAHHGNC